MDSKINLRVAENSSDALIKYCYYSIGLNNVVKQFNLIYSFFQKSSLTFKSVNHITIYSSLEGFYTVDTVIL